MSRGPGWLQQRLLEELNKSNAEMHTDQLAATVFGLQRDPEGCFNLSRSQCVSVHRALTKLADAGAIHCFGRQGYRDRRCRWGSLACLERWETTEKENRSFRDEQERAILKIRIDMEQRYRLRLSAADVEKLFNKYSLD